MNGAGDYINRIVYPAAMRLLPPGFNTREAHAMLLATGLQESRFEHRFQIRGPALGFWQSEYGGGAWTGILTHAKTSRIAHHILRSLAYGEPDREDFEGIAHNDILACAFARLLLYTHPKRLPARADHDGSWAYYMDTWRPGKPHRSTWNTFYDVAWNLAEA